jgi:predicted nucleic acid-binding protein
MRKYALDSNILSYLLKGDTKILKRVESESLAGSEISIPPIVYYEVKRGLLAVNSVNKMKMFLSLCSENAVGDMNIGVMDIAADIYVSFRKLGRAVEDADILIAAFCLEHGYTLVTHNVRHFEGVKGLKVEDWRG